MKHEAHAANADALDPLLSLPPRCYHTPPTRSKPLRMRWSSDKMGPLAQQAPQSLGQGQGDPSRRRTASGSPCPAVNKVTMSELFDTLFASYKAARAAAKANSTAETDPVFLGSEAKNLVSGDKADIDTAAEHVAATGNPHNTTPADIGAVPIATKTSLGNVSGTLTPNYSTSSWQAASLTDATTLAVPANGTAGARLELWLTASGADRNLTLADQIEVPSDSAFVGPKTLTSGKTYIVVLRSPNGADWWLQSLVGGY